MAVILTGSRIGAEVAAGRITVDPFDPQQLEPNSYGFCLGPELLVYDTAILDAHQAPQASSVTLPVQGLVLLPDRLYLGHTAEILGSDIYAAELYASRSVAALGVWITYSAPLGHAGAVVRWTLEIRVAQPVLLYPGMPIGKIAFWAPRGRIWTYEGKYTDSRAAMASRLAEEFSATPTATTPGGTR